MKNCPSCNEQPVTLTRWLIGLDSMKTKCKNCGIDLSANAVNWIGVGLMFLAMILVGHFVMTEYDMSFRRDKYKIILIALAPAVVISIISFFIGGYKSKK